jgi:hypothetical protein
MVDHYEWPVNREGEELEVTTLTLKRIMNGPVNMEGKELQVTEIE